jgi:cellulose synthase/poly-beta-1,6-N-acetylglucosamine synthase-like glycosyltransferase
MYKKLGLICSVYSRSLHRDPDESGLENYSDLLETVPNMEKNSWMSGILSGSEEIMKGLEYHHFEDTLPTCLIGPSTQYVTTNTWIDKYLGDSHPVISVGTAFETTLNSDDFAGDLYVNCPSVSEHMTLRNNIRSLYKEITSENLSNTIVSNIKESDTPKDWVKVVLNHYGCRMKLWAFFLRIIISSLGMYELNTLDQFVFKPCTVLSDKPKISIVIPCSGSSILMLERCVSHVMCSCMEFKHGVKLTVSCDFCPEIVKWCEEKGIDCVVSGKAKRKGFSVSCNLGAAHAIKPSTEYVIFLNDDCFIGKDTILKMYEFIELNKSIGICSPAFLWMDGSIQECGTRIYEDGRTDWIGCFKNKSDIQENPPYVSATCAMFRKRLFQEIGGFDTQFDMYYEDVDMCMKAKKQGYQLEYVKNCHVHHSHSFIGGLFDPNVKSWGKDHIDASRNLFYKKWMSN